jgi:predicted dithiol-disulfide oxidoreductase (DUF899 family)
VYSLITVKSMTSTIAHPPIVSRDQWLVQRKQLLAHEKELTKQYDRTNAERRRLPMVKLEKDYIFEGPNGKRNLKALFEGRRQLIVYHFMFDPAWDKGCSGCTGYIDGMGIYRCSISATPHSLSSLAPRSRNSRPINLRKAGPFRGFPHSEVISTTIST